MKIDTNYYQAPQPERWTGRNDGTNDNQQRWHQSVQLLDLHQAVPPVAPNSIAFLGFASDEGVKRNEGRPGAAFAPPTIRSACANFPVISGTSLFDAGDILCYDNNLEEAQQQLAIAVQQLLQAGIFPILLGGGHEITFGHYFGLQQQNPSESIGIINFDAHFDLRKPGTNGISSGTGFWQIAQECERTLSPFHYLALGIQASANTPELFERANELGVHYILDGQLNPIHLDQASQSLQHFCQQANHLALTIDMDVFSAAYAPGVSAVNPKGLNPDYIFDHLLSTILLSGKVRSIDIAEVNPTYDIDGRTARLAARLIFDIINLIGRSL